MGKEALGNGVKEKKFYFWWLLTGIKSLATGLITINGESIAHKPDPNQHPVQISDQLFKKSVSYTSPQFLATIATVMMFFVFIAQKLFAVLSERSLVYSSFDDSSFDSLSFTNSILQAPASITTSGNALLPVVGITNQMVAVFFWAVAGMVWRNGAGSQVASSLLWAGASVIMCANQAVMATSDPTFVTMLGGNGDGAYRIASSFIRTQDGYIGTGYTNSSVGNGVDLLVMMFNLSGDLVSIQSLGGGASDYGLNIKPVKKGGYVVTGYTGSFGAGNNDAFAIILTENMTISSAKTYGGLLADYSFSIAENAAGNLFFGGYTNSFGAGGSDLWFVELYANLTISLVKTVGGGNQDMGYFVDIFQDQLLVAGRTNSFSVGKYDAWVLRFNINGTLEQTTVFGGLGTDFANVVRKIPGDGSVVIGVTDYGAGGQDVLLVRLTEDGKLRWGMAYGEKGDDQGLDVLPIKNGGFLITGYLTNITNTTNAFVANITEDGTPSWVKIFKSGSDSVSHFIQTTPSGGIVFGGNVKNLGGRDLDLLFAAFNSNDNTDGCNITAIANLSVMNITDLLTVTFPNPVVTTPVITVKDWPISVKRIDVNQTMGCEPHADATTSTTTTKNTTPTTIPSTSTTTNFPPPVVSQPGLALIVTGANKFQLISAASSVSVTLQLARAIGSFMTTVAGLPPVRFTADPLLNTLTMTGSPADINTALNKLRFSLNDGNEAFDQAAVRISAFDGSSTVSDVGTLARFGSNRAPGPTGYGYANTTINLNTQFTIDFSTLMPNPFADPDGDPMTYLLMLVNGQSLLSSGMQFINGKVLGGLFLRPDVYEFDVLATDGYKTSQFSVRFQLTGGYLPPFLNKLIDSVTVDVGVPVSIGIDPKTFVGNGLTYFANRDIAGLDYPLPSYLLFDSVSLQLRGVMPADETLNVTVGARDLYGSIVTTWFLLRAFDVPPRLLRPIVDQMAIALQRLVISIPHDTFNSSKPLGYSLTALSNGDPLPAWVVWNENTKEVVAIPNKDALGQNFTLRLTASDGYKSSALNITLVVPSNQPPYIMRDLQSAIAIAGQLFNYPFDDAFKSPMNYSLSFSIAPDDNVTVLPGWSSLSPINALYGTPTDGDIGSFRVRVSVDDGLGGVASQVVSITVERSLIASILYYGQFAAAIGGPILTAWGAYRNRAQFYNFFKGRGTEIECPFYNTKKCKLNESGELSYNIKGNKKEKKNDAYPHAKYLNVYRKLAPGESGCIERALPRLFAFSHYLGRQFGLVELAWGSASPAWMNFDKEQGILTIEVDKLDEQPVTLIITTIDGLILSQFEVDPLKIKLIYKEEIAAYQKKKNNAVTKTQEQHEGSSSAKVVSLKKTHGQSQKKESSAISNGAARNLTKVGDWELSLLSTSSSSKAGRSRSALRLLETASNKEKKDEKPKRVSSSTSKKQPLPIFLAQDSKQESSESRESSGGSGSGKQRSSSSDLNRSLLDSRGHSFPLSPKTSLTNVTDFFRKFSDEPEEAIELRCVSSSVRTKKAVESKPVSSSVRTKEEKKKFDLLSASETRKSSTSSGSKNQGLSLNRPGLFSRSSSDAIKKQAGEQFSKKNKNEPRINRVA